MPFKGQMIIRLDKVLKQHMNAAHTPCAAARRGREGCVGPRFTVAKAGKKANLDTHPKPIEGPLPSGAIKPNAHGS